MIPGSEHSSKPKPEILIQSDRLLIYKSTPGDIPCIVELEKKNHQFVGVYTADFHQTLIVDPDCLHLKFCVPGQEDLMGYALLFGLEFSKRSIELRRIVIRDKGKGFGREALRLIHQYCFRQLSARSIWLDVFEDNERAQHLYRSEGYHFFSPGMEKMNLSHGDKKLLYLIKYSSCSNSSLL